MEECYTDNVENVIRYYGEWYKMLLENDNKILSENVIRYCGECYKR